MKTKIHKYLKFKKEFKKHKYFREVCDCLGVKEIDREIIIFLSKIKESYTTEIDAYIPMDPSRRWLCERLSVMVDKGCIDISRSHGKRRYYRLNDNFKKLLCSFSNW